MVQEKTMRLNHLLMAVSVLGVLGAASVLAAQVARESQRKQTKKEVDRKLDMAVEASMDCSDAIASY